MSIVYLAFLGTTLLLVYKNKTAVAATLNGVLSLIGWLRLIPYDDPASHFVLWASFIAMIFSFLAAALLLGFPAQTRLSRIFLWVGLFINIPITGLIVYLEFFFHIF